MKPELELKIKNAYPELFTDMIRPHFEFGDGWFILFSDLCEELSRYNTSIRLVKEKWGGLRVFFVADAEVYDKVSDIVARAEVASLTICEECGLSGNVIDNNYVRTLCDRCSSKTTQKRYA